MKCEVPDMLEFITTLFLLEYKHVDSNQSATHGQHLRVAILRSCISAPLGTRFMVAQ
jgi:hypothetical protein